MSKDEKRTDGEVPESFEAALAELESLVNGLERGELTLDESVAAFERGTGLLKHLTGKLEQAEKRVKVLLETDGGDLMERLFEEGDE